MPFIPSSSIALSVSFKVTSISFTGGQATAATNLSGYFLTISVIKKSGLTKKGVMNIHHPPPDLRLVSTPSLCKGAMSNVPKLSLSPGQSRRSETKQEYVW